MLRLNNFTSKSVIVIKLDCANATLKTAAAKVPNPGVVIYLSWLWSVSLFSTSVTFVL